MALAYLFPFRACGAFMAVICSRFDPSLAAVPMRNRNGVINSAQPPMIGAQID
jgi:hypothetical protein